MEGPSTSTSTSSGSSSQLSSVFHSLTSDLTSDLTSGLKMTSAAHASLDASKKKQLEYKIHECSSSSSTYSAE